MIPYNTQTRLMWNGRAFGAADYDDACDVPDTARHRATFRATWQNVAFLTDEEIARDLAQAHAELARLGLAYV